MSRDPALYVADMIEACERIVTYTAGLDQAGLRSDRRTVDAIVRNLEVLGEAAKRVAAEHKARASGIPWREIAGMRDVLITITSGSISTSSATSRSSRCRAFSRCFSSSWAKSTRSPKRASEVRLCIDDAHERIPSHDGHSLSVRRVRTRGSLRGLGRASVRGLPHWCRMQYGRGRRPRAQGLDVREPE